MRPGFLCDNNAIAPVIGFALVLAILVSTLGFVQTKFVPVWNAEFESGHFEDVYNDLVLFSANIESAAVSGIPRTSPVKLGLVYPKRGIFYNPKPLLFGSLEVKQDVNVTVNYTTVFNTTSKTFPSSSIRYELPGNHPFLVYEHGIVIRDFSKFGRGNATGSPNTMIVGDDINLPFLLINGSGFSSISVEPEIFSIYPIELTSKSNFVEYLQYINITMDTHYPEVWKLTFNKSYIPGQGDLVYTSSSGKTTVRVNSTSGKIYINTTAGNEIDLPDYASQVTQASRLYAGMAVVKTVATLASYKGTGQESMSVGSVWKDVPPSNELSQFILTNITIDDSSLLQNDIITFKIVDLNGNYWMVTVYFKVTGQNSEIEKITGKTMRVGVGVSETNYTDISPVTNATRIDLLKGVFAANGNGNYSVSNVTTPNVLVSSFMGDTTGYDPDTTGLIYYRLIIQ